MTTHTVVSADEWREARIALLTEEKALTRAGDALATKRRELPWTLMDEYVFQTSEGPESLSELFAGRGQLAMYHFMFGPDWTQGCHRCSYWADSFNGIDIHLAHRDTTFIACSNTSIESIEAYKERMGWSFKWVSALDNGFNQFMRVSFGKEEYEAGTADYNFGAHPPYFQEMQGLSVFAKTDEGQVARAYSTFGRGIDVFSNTYQILDLTPKGRDEQDLGFDPMTWIQRHDQYKDG